MLLAIAVVVCVYIVGTIGYVILQDCSLFDAPTIEQLDDDDDDALSPIVELDDPLGALDGFSDTDDDEFSDLFADISDEDMPEEEEGLPPTGPLGGSKAASGISGFGLRIRAINVVRGRVFK